MGPVKDCQLEVSPDLNHSWLQFRTRIGFLYTRSCMVLLLPWKPCSWHSSHIKRLKRSQFTIECQCILRKKYSERAYFDEVIPTCFRGPVFKNTVYCLGFDAILYSNVFYLVGFLSQIKWAYLTLICDLEIYFIP